jgi:hypothetical protein
VLLKRAVLKLVCGRAAAAARANARVRAAAGADGLAALRVRRRAREAIFALFLAQNFSPKTRTSVCRYARLIAFWQTRTARAACGERLRCLYVVLPAPADPSLPSNTFGLTV